MARPNRGSRRPQEMEEVNRGESTTQPYTPEIGSAQAPAPAAEGVGRRKGLLGSARGEFSAATTSAGRAPSYDTPESEPTHETGGSSGAAPSQFDPDAARLSASAPFQSPATIATAFSINDDILAAKEALRARLLNAGVIRPFAVAAQAERRSNIVGFGIGEKNRAEGRPTGDLAVKVYVVKKQPQGLLPEGQLIPSTIGRYQTDVVEVGRITPLSAFFEPEDPVVFGGSAVSREFGGIGTYGCMVYSRDNQYCLLSNTHVLADSPQSAEGDYIYHPGNPGSFGRRVIGSLKKFVEVRFDQVNEVDAAIAWTGFRFVSPEHHSYIIGTRSLQAASGMSVRKEGFITGLTVGTVIDTNANIPVDYPNGRAEFINLIQIRGEGSVFSDHGDSGSLVVDAHTFQPVALLFAGGGNFTWAIPIDKVMRALGLARFVNVPE